MTNVVEKNIPRIVPNMHIRALLGLDFSSGTNGESKTLKTYASFELAIIST